MRTQYAFSLLETLMVLAIVVILAAVAAPMLQQFYAHTHEQLLQAQLLHAIELAKQEARARHTSVVLCGSDDQKTCSDAWLKSQMVFVDVDADGVVHDHAQLLAVLQVQTMRGELHWRHYPYYRHYLLFQPTNITHADDGTFWYCRAVQSLPVWAIVINRAVRARVIYPDSDGLIRDSHGKALNC